MHSNCSYVCQIRTHSILNLTKEFFNNSFVAAKMIVFLKRPIQFKSAISTFQILITQLSFRNCSWCTNRRGTNTPLICEIIILVAPHFQCNLFSAAPFSIHYPPDFLCHHQDLQFLALLHCHSLHKIF